MSSLNQNYDFRSGQIGPSAATNLGVTAPQLGDVRPYIDLTVIITGLATETINVFLATDAGAASANALRPIDMSTGVVAASSNLGNGTYSFTIDGAQSITFTKSAGVDTCTIRYALSRYA